jgi:hypothetical protein
MNALRLQELVELHGDLRIDGVEGIDYWPADEEGPAFFLLNLA